MSELEQDGNKPLFYAVHGVFVDMPVFKWRRFGFACCNGVKPRLRLPLVFHGFFEVDRIQCFYPIPVPL